MPIDPLNAGSGRFVNFSRILGLNRPSVDAQTNVLTSQVDAQGQAAQNAITGTEKKYRSDIAGATPIANASGTYDYSGPSTFDWSDPRAKVRTASDSLNALKTPYGTEGMLQTQSYGGAGYTPGMSRWDTALMYGGGAADRFQPLQDRYSGLQSAFSSARTGVDAAARDARSTAAATHQPVPAAAPAAPQQSITERRAGNQNFGAFNERRERMQDAIDQRGPKGHGTGKSRAGGDLQDGWNTFWNIG